jgi:capsular exopolysaccharide synthesis family protein
MALDDDPDFETEGQDAAVVGDGRVPLLPDPGLLWQIFRRNLLLFAIVVAAIIGLTAAIMSVLTPQYAAASSLLIQPTGAPVETAVRDTSRNLVGVDEVDTEIAIISSPQVAERAAELYAVRFASPDGDAFRSEELAILAKKISRTITVSRRGDVRVVDILAVNEDPAFAAASANLLAEAYLLSQIESKTARSDNSSEFINARLAELQSNAIATQTAVDQYRASRGLSSNNSATNAEQEVSNLNTQLAQARADLAEKRGRYNSAREQMTRGGAGADVGAALGSGTVASLRQQESNASARLAVLRERYGPLHPERRQVEQELKDIRERIQDEIDRVLSNLEAEVQTAQSRVSSIESSRGSALGAVRGNSMAQTGLSALEQKAAAAQAIYESFLERSQESGALRNSAMPDATIASRAVVPSAPSSPNYFLIALAGLVLAISAGLFAILMAEYLRRGVQTKRDVERRLQLRYAGAIPILSSTIKGRRTIEAPHDYVLKHPHSLFAEAFRSIRTFLTLSPGTRPRTIAVTSALPGEGKTTTAVCLARTSAAEGLSVVIVDADLRRRGTSILLDYDSQNDIFAYLLDGAMLEDCIQKDPLSGLHVLGSRSEQEEARNPLTEARIAKMFDELRSVYDIVIVDTAPILGVAEGRILATAADRVLVITKWKRTSMRAVEAAIAMLIDAKAKVTGLALSQVNIKQYASTGDGDVYAYTKKFRGYYQN